MNVTIKTTTDGIAVQAPFLLKDVCKSIAGATWDPDRRAWLYSPTPGSARAIADAFAGHQVFTDHDYDVLLDQARRAEAVEPGPNEPLPLPDLYTIRPRPLQVRGFRHIEMHAATMLPWQMGMGKSYAVVLAVANLDCKLTLIVCPKSVVSVWPREFARNSPVTMRVVPLDEDSVKKRARTARLALQMASIRKERLVLVVNYEATWLEEMAEVITSYRWDLLVCDESHRIKSATAKASKFLGNVAHLARRRVCLSGTPMSHSPLDVFGQYRFLDQRVFGKWFTHFRARYAIMGGYKPNKNAPGVQVMGYQNLPELHDKFYSIAVKATEADALDLPPVVHETRDVVLGAAAMKAYRELERDFVTEVDQGLVTVSNALSKLLKLQQVTSGYVKIDEEETGGKEVMATIDHARRDVLSDFLEDLGPSEPVVVFCRFRHDIDQICAAVNARDRKCFELSGRVNNLAEWQQAQDGSVIAVQIQAGGVGIDLTRAAYCVYYSMGLSLGDYLQSLARLHRPGQGRSVTYMHLVAKGTVDEKVYAALDSKQEVIEGVLNMIKVGIKECTAGTTVGVM